LVRLSEDRSVREFLEKPSPDQIDTDLISAGAYVLERDVLELIPPDTNASIERDVFPELVGDGLYGCPGNGYWLDIGTPDRYLQATFDILERNVDTAVGNDLGENYLSVAGDASFNGRVVPPARVGRGCRIADDARVGSLAVLGDNVRVGEGTTIERAVVFDGTEIGPHCRLRYCVLGAGARVGENTHIEGGAVLGEGVTIGADNILSHGARIFPGVSLPDGAIRF
jgi:mannose-1-phosphate guanylyltransferase